MTADEFREIRDEAALPEGLTPPLLALWHDARGDWELAHRTVQDWEDGDAAWVHAYLHRKEGDAGNAAYWYRRAGKSVPGDALEAEWHRLVGALLKEDKAPSRVTE